MKQEEEGSFAFQGTTLHLRLWVGEKAGERPVVIVEEGKGKALSANRIELVKDISESLGINPQNLDWYEQRTDGSLREFQFQPYHTEHRPYANDMSMQDYRTAEKAGDRKPEIYTAYTISDQEVTPQKRQQLETTLNDRLESYEQKQNREFEQMNYRFLAQSP